MSVLKRHSRQKGLSGFAAPRIPNRVTAWRKVVRCMHIMEKAWDTAEWEDGSAQELVLTR